MIVRFNEREQFNIELTKDEHIGDFGEQEENQMPVKLKQSEGYTVSLAMNEFDVDISNLHPMGEYNGAYNITPSEETQVLQTTGKRLTHNVVVEPIPENYGLITWNGAVLTIS